MIEYNKNDRVEHIPTGIFGDVEVQFNQDVLVNWSNAGWTSLGKLADWVNVKNLRKVGK